MNSPSVLTSHASSAARLANVPDVVGASPDTAPADDVCVARDTVVAGVRA